MRLRQLVPASCPRCGFDAGSGYCPACRAEFARIRDPCTGCGLPRPCSACPSRAPGWHLDRLLAPFAYAEPLKHELQALKYAKRRHLGAALGRLLADELRPERLELDALAPVPLHPGRLRERSFNQADEIARPLADALDLPLLCRGIRRLRATGPQTTLSRPARLRALDQAFEAEGPVLRGAAIGIVDDVVTTGATVNALASALRAAGAGPVIALAVARTIGPAGARDQPMRNW